ncbi:unnamed protein product [Blepharisma stoltei]|uniref:Uncharacterized protein n=1 Tax=Blepharisma stoltei TaxID=1481888 RepID=A0AAU9JPX9_9CILI|nr:unnamed protein product [Blepharisma stoltei]
MNLHLNGILKQDMSFEVTSAASAALKVMQTQLKELRDQNQQLQNKFFQCQTKYNDEKSAWEQEMDRLSQLFHGREQDLIAQLNLMSDKVLLLESSNRKLEDDVKNLRTEAKNNAEKDGTISLLQSEIRNLKRQLSSKEEENELILRRVQQLEKEKRSLESDYDMKINEKINNMSGNTSFNYSRRETDISRRKDEEEFPMKIQKPQVSLEIPEIDGEADRVEEELENLKAEYRNLKNNSYQYDTEWRQRMENIMKQIENKSEVLLRLRESQRKFLKSRAIG